MYSGNDLGNDLGNDYFVGYSAKTPGQGELLRPLTIEHLERLDYKPKSRNKKIVDVLLRRKLMDKRGTGILRIKEAMRKWRLPKLSFKEDTGYFVIKFTGPYQETVIEYKEELNERQRKALEYVKINQKITPREYRTLNNIAKETAWKDINELLEKGLLIKKSSGAHTYYILRPNDRPNDRVSKNAKSK